MPRESESKSKPRLLTDDRALEAASEILSGEYRKRGPARLLPFLGPAFIASVAYVDPGNFATNIQGGAQFGYTLLWVVVASNLMAMLIQVLSAKLGIGTGQNLAELCRCNFSRPTVIGMWLLMEVVAMATDLAEFIGAAVGFNLLLGLPLWIAGFLTAFATTLILGLERYGFRPLEAVITSLVGVISISYLIETILDKPDWGQVMYHAVVPHFAGNESVLLATGILGATVMPHVIFLHSALTQGRIVTRDPVQMKRLFSFEVADVTIAMGVAGLINAAMLLMAASTFHGHDVTNVATIEEAYLTLNPPAGISSKLDFCHLLAGLRAFVLFGGNHVGPGGHAGFPPPADPGLDPPSGDYGAFLDSNFDRTGSYPYSDYQPGYSQFWVAICHYPVDPLHYPQEPHGSAGQPLVYERFDFNRSCLDHFA